MDTNFGAYNSFGATNSVYFLYEYHTYKQIEQKLQSLGALNIQETPGYN